MLDRQPRPVLRDLALRRAGGGVLPDYDAVIFDEAHTLEDVAADHLGIRVSQGGVEYLLNQLLAPRTQKGILATLGDGDAVAQLDATRQASEQFFAAVHEWHQSQPRGTGRVREPGIVPDHLSEELKKLATQLHELAEGRESEEEQLELTSRGDRLGGMATLRAGSGFGRIWKGRSTGSRCGRAACRGCRSPARRSRSARH